MKNKKWKKASQVLNSLAKIQPSPDILVNQADCLFQLRRFKECISAANKSLALNPMNSKSLYLLAMCFLETKQYGKAYILMLKAKKAGWDPQEVQSKIKSLNQAIRQRQRVSFNKIA